MTLLERIAEDLRRTANHIETQAMDLEGKPHSIQVRKLREIIEGAAGHMRMVAGTREAPGRNLIPDPLSTLGKIGKEIDKLEERMEGRLSVIDWATVSETIVNVRTLIERASGESSTSERSTPPSSTTKSSAPTSETTPPRSSTSRTRSSTSPGKVGKTANLAEEIDPIASDLIRLELAVATPDGQTLRSNIIHALRQLQSRLRTPDVVGDA